MFRRKWHSLPEDPIFGNTLSELGYFINDDDEIRSIQDPNSYFKYCINRNERWNMRQSAHFNAAISKIIIARLEDFGLQKVLLPLGTLAEKPHVPIFVSSNIKTTKRVILIVPEPKNELGVLAKRVISGKGGINTGSLVSVWNDIRNKYPDTGLVIANPGSLWWDHKSKRGVTVPELESLPMKSAAHLGLEDPVYWEEHVIPRNRLSEDHIKCVFQDVLLNCDFVNPEAGIDVIAIATATSKMHMALNINWDEWKHRVKSYFSVCGFESFAQIAHPEFAAWLRERGFAFASAENSPGTLISGPDGNFKTRIFTDFGCPVFSAKDGGVAEIMFIKNYPMILEMARKVYEADLEPGGFGFKHPEYSDCSFQDDDYDELVPERWNAMDIDSFTTITSEADKTNDEAGS